MVLPGHWVSFIFIVNYFEYRPPEAAPDYSETELSLPAVVEPLEALLIAA